MRYKIRVKFSCDDVDACGFIIKAYSLIDCYNRIANLMSVWEFNTNEYQIISIGEL